MFVGCSCARAQEQGIAKLEEIFTAVQDACPHEVTAIRSAFAVTLVSQYPFRHIQIVTRLYNSPAGTATCATLLLAYWCRGGVGQPLCVGGASSG